MDRYDLADRIINGEPGEHFTLIVLDFGYAGADIVGRPAIAICSTAPKLSKDAIDYAKATMDWLDK